MLFSSVILKTKITCHAASETVDEKRTIQVRLFLHDVAAVALPWESYENALIVKRIFLTPSAKSSVSDVHEG